MPPILERPSHDETGSEWGLEIVVMHHDSCVEARESRLWGAYEAAITRTRLWAEVNPRSWSGTRPQITDVTLEVLFENLADQWEAETAFESVVTRKVMHPAYQRIIGLGDRALPLILRRLQREPRQWFWALTAITGDDAAAGVDSAQDAADAWLRWGRDCGLVGG